MISLDLGSIIVEIDDAALDIELPEQQPSVTLSALTGNFTLSEAAAQNAVAGTLSGQTAGSTLSIISNAGSRVALSGQNIVRGTVALDYEAATSHSFTVRETLAGATNSPRDTTFTLAVTNVLDAPTLAALSLSATNFTTGTPSSGTIVGATAGSTIAATNLPAGLTVNGAARTFAWDGTGSVSTPSITLTETLGDSPNSPRATNIGLTISSSVTLGTLTLSASKVTRNVAATVSIVGATAGSTIAGTVPDGMTLNSGARTITGTPSQVGVYNFSLTETLAGATNSPKANSVSLEVEAGTLALKVLAEGDSITAYTNPDSYSRLWAADNSSVPYRNNAVGGGGLGVQGDSGKNNLFSRQQIGLDYNPSHISVLIGANDLPTDTTEYLNRLYQYLAPFKARGVKTIVCTVLPRDLAGWETKRTAANNKLRADAGTQFDLLVDFDQTVMGLAAAAVDPQYYPDGLHPSALGHSIMRNKYGPVLNHSIGITNEVQDFAFDAVVGAAQNSQIESSTYTVKGLYTGESRPLTVSTGAAASKNGAAFVTNLSTTVVNGDTVRLRNSSAGTGSTKTEVSATIGNKTALFSVITAGAGSRAWVPTDLGSKLAVWLKPEAWPTYAQGARVESWPDSSANAITILKGGSSGAPLMDLSGPNGFRSVKFEAAQQTAFFMPSGWLSGRTSSATFFIAKNETYPNTGLTGAPVMHWGTNTGDFYSFSNGGVYSAYGRATRIDNKTPFDPLNEWHMGMFLSAPNDWRFYQNGKDVFTTTTNTVAFGTAPKLFSTYVGHGAEVIDLLSAPTTIERQQIEGYLAHKYALQSKLPDGHPYKATAPTI